MKSLLNKKKIVIVIIFIALSSKLFSQKKSNEQNVYYELQKDSILEKITKITDGKHIFYNKNRQILIQGTFINGILIDGLVYIRNKNGFLYSIRFYENGKYLRNVHAVEIQDTLSKR